MLEPPPLELPSAALALAARVETGRERAKLFSWERSVDLLCECFERSLARC